MSKRPPVQADIDQGGPSPWDKYLRIVMMADAKYRVDGVLTVSIGLEPTRFTLIERFAFNRFLNHRQK